MIYFKLTISKKIIASPVVYLQVYSRQSFPACKFKITPHQKIQQGARFLPDQTQFAVATSQQFVAQASAQCRIA